MRGFPHHLNWNQKVAAIDKAMNVVAVIHPMTALPQIFQIYATKDVTGVSLLTWILFMFIGVVFLAYGILHKIKPLIILQLLWFIVDGAVVTGILLYG